MLERYFGRPDTIDRRRASWIAEPLERYVAWLTEERYAARTILRRVPIVVCFGEFAHARGATTWADLVDYVEPFGQFWLRAHGRSYPTPSLCQKAGDAARHPVWQMLRLVVPGDHSLGRRRRLQDPFADQAPGFFRYLREARGLRDTAIEHYGHYLRALEQYLSGIGLAHLHELSPPVLSAFILERRRCGSINSKSALQGVCSALRVFLRYLSREGLIARDLRCALEGPPLYRLSDIPRSIAWDEVRRMFEAVDRRTPLGKRDDAMLLLLVTYGLRAREVAALTRDNIDWKRERLDVPERKAGHSTAYPLSPIVGEAIVDYLQNGRPQTTDRHVFFRVLAPCAPLTWNAIGSRTAHDLHKAGIPVARPGSHTLRHACVQRLVDAHFSLKTLGDYVGHRSPASTAIYTKVALETLRELA